MTRNQATVTTARPPDHAATVAVTPPASRSQLKMLLAAIVANSTVLNVAIAVNRTLLCAAGRRHAAADEVANVRASDRPAHSVSTRPLTRNPTADVTEMSARERAISPVVADAWRCSSIVEPRRVTSTIATSATFAGNTNRNSLSATALPSTDANASASRSWSRPAQSSTGRSRRRCSHHDVADAPRSTARRLQLSIAPGMAAG